MPGNNNNESENKLVSNLSELINDPVTFLPYENPVSIECGHVFSKKTIDTLAEYNKCECPTCRQPFKPDNLRKVFILKELVGIVNNNNSVYKNYKEEHNLLELSQKLNALKMSLMILERELHNEKQSKELQIRHNQNLKKQNQLFEKTLLRLTAENASLEKEMSVISQKLKKLEQDYKNEGSKNLAFLNKYNHLYLSYQELSKKINSAEEVLEENQKLSGELNKEKNEKRETEKKMHAFLSKISTLEDKVRELTDERKEDKELIHSLVMQLKVDKQKPETNKRESKKSCDFQKKRKRSQISDRQRSGEKQKIETRRFKPSLFKRIKTNTKTNNGENIKMKYNV